MLRIFAANYLDLGEHIQHIRVTYWFDESQEKRPEELSSDDAEHIKDGLSKMFALCGDLDLPVSHGLLKNRLVDIPKTSREFDILVEAVYSELKSRTFIYLLPHLAKYYENHDVLSAKATLAFPACRNELWDASNSLATGLWTAAVFHSMRAAEIGVRLLARDLGVAFPDKTIEQAEWAQLLDQADSKIKAIGQLPRSDQRDRDQLFYSTAAAQFRYFKDGWRVRVAHAKAVYAEAQATKILEHTEDFFETLAERLVE